MNKRWLYILLIWLPLSGWAQDFDLEEEPQEEEVYRAKVPEIDSLLRNNYQTHNPLEKHELPNDFYDKYTGEEYDYTLTKPHKSLWERFIDKVSYYLSDFFDAQDANQFNKMTRIFLYILSGAIILGAAYYLFKVFFNKDGNWFFSKNNDEIEPDNRDIEENIHEIDFPKIIQEFEQKKDYRSALRYQFLQGLKALADHQKIAWILEKTNADYLEELTQAEHKKLFSRAVYIFDHVWYGEIPINKEKYEQLLPEIQTLNQIAHE